MFGIIYSVTNKINQKKYIGFCSSVSCYKNRIKRHKKGTSGCPKLKLAILKYGWDVFEPEILYMSKDPKHTLEVMEPYFIELYDSIRLGYNILKGGRGTIGYRHTIQTKQKMCSAAKNRPGISAETRIKLSLALKGRVFGPEWKQNLSRAKLGTVWDEEYKIKMKYACGSCYEIKTPQGISLSIFSLSDYARCHNLNYGSLKNAIRRGRPYKGYLGKKLSVRSPYRRP